jgi:microcystin-dependent protein
MESYIGEIRIFPYNRIPRGWMACNGQSLPVGQYAALYSLIVNRYGGNNENFNLPNLNGRTLVGADYIDSNYMLGKSGGLEKVALTAENLPAHTHTISVSETYDNINPNTNFLANPNAPKKTPQTPTNEAPVNRYKTNALPTFEVALNNESISNTGGSAAHENRMPFIALPYCIAVIGYYPPRSDD